MNDAGREIAAQRRHDEERARYAAEVQHQHDTDAALLRIIDGMTDADLRQLISQGAANAPHLVVEKDTMLEGRVQGSREAMKHPLTPSVVMNHQHLRVLAKHAVGLLTRGGTNQ